MITNPNLLFSRDYISGSKNENFSLTEHTEKQFKDALNILASDDTSIIIYGDRGTGKTSLAWQICSTLSDKNDSFSKEDYLVFDTDKEFKCIFFTAGPQIRNIYELLLNILRPSSNINSLSKVFSKFYEDNQLKLQLKAKFKIDLLGLMDVELDVENNKRPKLNNETTYSSLASNRLVELFFEEVISEIKRSSPKTEIIFFIDEIEKVSDKDGLGSLIKNMNLCKFVFIAVADTIKEIIVDHKSAARKLIGGDLEVPGLSDSQIEWIFRNAEKKSRGGVTFSSEFISLAIKYCNGFPWLAQNLGHYSIMGKLSNGISKDEHIHIDSNDFGSTIKYIMSIYRHDQSENIDFASATDNYVRVKILDYLWSCKHLPTEDEIRDHLGNNSARFATASLTKLKEDGIIKKNQNNKIVFYDAIIRVLIRFHLDYNIDKKNV